jgi:chloramphenicol 3-O-phosphotransferase
MKLIFLYGLPATGKLSVAQELSAMTGYKLFHNHLTVDLLLSVFDFGSPGFVALREEIWLSVFDQAAVSQLQALIFTFAPEPTVSAGFLEKILEAITRRGGEVEFVELVCPMGELKRRLNSPSRHRYGKLTSADLFDQIYADAGFDGSFLPKPRLSLDTSLCTAAQAAAKIAEVLQLDLSLT